MIGCICPIMKAADWIICKNGEVCIKPNFPEDPTDELPVHSTGLKCAAWVTATDEDASGYCALMNRDAGVIINNN